MGIIGWLKDTCIGKENESAIYGEMKEIDRRRVNKRQEFIQEKLLDYKKSLSIYIDKSKSCNQSYEEYEVKKCKYLILSNVYKNWDDNFVNDPEEYQRRVIADCFEWMGVSNDLRSTTWVEVFRLLKEDEVVSSLMPKIFKEEFILDWEAYRDNKVIEERERKIKEENENNRIKENLERQRREKKEKKEKIQYVISELERNHSRQMSLFMSMSPGMSRTELSISIDNTERHIAIYKEELRKLG